MSLRLTKPGASVALRHPKTGEILKPIFITKHGKAVWPQLGASSDDPDDPAYGGGEGGNRHEDVDDEDDDEDEEDQDEDDKPRSKKDEDEDDKKPTRPERQAARYRTQLREEQRKTAELENRLRKLEDSDKPADEVMTRDLAEARSQIESLTEVNRIMTAQLAFFKSNTVDWADSSDAFALAEREGMFDELIDDSGNVDAAELRRSLRDLAKRKPHLVKKSTEDPKARGRRSKDDDEDEDKEQRSKSASSMNGNRRGREKTPDRAALAGRFPVLKVPS